MTCIRPGIASAGGSFPPEDSLEKYRRCGRRAFLCCGACFRFCFGRCRSSASGRVGTYLTNNFVLLPT